MIGHVECGEWPRSNESKSMVPHQASPIASDWALVWLQDQHLTSFNEFAPPGLSGRQKINEFVKLQDLSAGEVIVCAGVSGYQRAFLSGNSTSVNIARSKFQVRTVSLEHSLGKHGRSQI